MAPPTPNALAAVTDPAVARDRRASRAIERPAFAAQTLEGSATARPLTVAIVAAALAGGAADEGAIDLARILAAAGHRVIVLAPGGRLEADLARSGATFVRLAAAGHNPFTIARNALTLRRLMQERGCDVLHAHGRSVAWSAWLAARLGGAPFLTTCYAGFGEQNVFKRWYNRVMARGDHVIAINEPVARYLAERHGVPRDRLSVIHAPLDLAPFDPGLMTAERIARVRAAWGAGDAARVILVPGRIIRRKGLHVVVRAAARLKAAGVKDFIVAFAGEDEGRSRYSGELWDLVLATGAADVVRIAGPVADRPACYAAATAVVVPAIQLEGLPREALEAMAMGRPVIASHLAADPQAGFSPPSAPEERVAGLRVPAGDDAALAAALVRVLDCQEAERCAMGRRGRAFVLSEFQSAKIAEQTLAVYARVAKAELRPDAGPRPAGIAEAPTPASRGR